MSFRTKLLAFVDVVMRIPPLFLLDEILKLNMSLPPSENSENNNNFFIDALNETTDNLTNTTTEEQSNINFYIFAITALKCLCCLIGKLKPFNRTFEVHSFSSSIFQCQPVKTKTTPLSSLYLSHSINVINAEL